ncbi:MAG TPA: outer membrane protein assembly factor BamA [Anaeromyxobacteraceae bacterium]|nr:outer membrane protein assembly factor BamA [Anaeromyxobacteraceae bacterium]
MRHSTARLALLLAVAAPGPAPAAAASGVPVVKDVRVEGNRRVEVDAIRAAISQKKGQPLDPRAVDRDIRAIMKLGFFDDVVVEEEGPPSAPVLVYRVVERPTVREARIAGNDELSKDDLKDAVQVKPFSVLDPSAVRQDVERLQQKYVEKGFYLAEVTYEFEPQPDNQVDVVYQVVEKAKVEVKEIRFLGNEHVPAHELEAAMVTRKGGYLSGLRGGGTFREDAFQHDLQALQVAYLDRGYLTVRMGTPTVALSPDRRFLFLTIPITEGDRYRIGKVSFSGQLLDREAQLRLVAQTRPRDMFSRAKLAQDLFALADVYKDLGHAYANVNPITDVHAEEKTVDITFEVQPGTKVRFERIEIVGNDRTRDKVIRRELRIHEGELFSGTGLRVSKQRVTALGFFETVEITTAKGSADDLMVATVEVKERATGTFQIGAGFSSYENFILTGQISQNNFFGWGQTLSLQVQWSSIRQLGQIQFVEPYFLDTRWTFAFDVYATEGFYSSFTRRAVGGNMTWGYELSGLADLFPFARRLEDMRLFATYTNEYVTSSPSGASYPLAGRYESGTTSSLRLALNWDKRDNRLFPSRGFYVSTSAEVAAPFLAPEWLFGEGVNLFTRYVVDGRIYRPLWFGLVGRARLSLGWIQSWRGDRLPISEMYFAGGINSIRGYRILSIAPQERVSSCTGPDCRTILVAVGGNKQAIFNAEIEFPLVGAAGIKGVVFYDAGNVFGPGEWKNETGPAFYQSVGFGFRWFSPVGPLRFEWGIPLNRREGIDQAVDFQFTIGSFF